MMLIDKNGQTNGVGLMSVSTVMAGMFAVLGLLTVGAVGWNIRVAYTNEISAQNSMLAAQADKDVLIAVSQLRNERAGSINFANGGNAEQAAAKPDIIVSRTDIDAAMERSLPIMELLHLPAKELPLDDLRRAIQDLKDLRQKVDATESTPQSSRTPDLAKRIDETTLYLDEAVELGDGGA